MSKKTVSNKKATSKKKEGSKFAMWEEANRERKTRQKFCDLLEKKYPSDHASVQEARRELAEAIAKYDRIVAGL
jgi:Spy/CpxP family protein refolding chaperone